MHTVCPIVLGGSQIAGGGGWLEGSNLEHCPLKQRERKVSCFFCCKFFCKKKEENLLQ